MRKLKIRKQTLIVLVAMATLLPLLSLTACGGEAAPTAVPPTSPPTPTAEPAPEPTPVPPPTAMPEPAATPAAPQPTAVPTTPRSPTEIPAPTAAPRTPQATAAPATPQPTTAPATPMPTAAPAVPVPTAAPATPQPTAAPARPVASCDGAEGGQLGNCAPEFSNTQEWVNSDPLTMESLRGKVVLIDFWTYTCINCIRTIPFLQTWHERYADEGLVIIGVHTPEFEFEKDYGNVVDATIDMGVAWPVVQDNNFSVWRSYNNRFWPAKYLIDASGEIRFRHFGEGRYAETEQEIRALLAEAGAASESFAQPLPGDQQVDQAYREGQARRTPELFAGWRFTQNRGGIGQVDTYLSAARASYQAGDQQGVVADFEFEGEIKPNLIYFHGPWAIGPESAVHARETEDYTDAIVLQYSARSVNAVLTSESGEPYKVVVTVNLSYLTEDNKGEDIIIGEDGESYLMVDSPKAYKLIEHEEWQEHQVLQMFSKSSDFGLFSFTFGTYKDGF